MKLKIIIILFVCLFTAVSYVNAELKKYVTEDGSAWYYVPYGKGCTKNEDRYLMAQRICVEEVRVFEKGEEEIAKEEIKKDVDREYKRIARHFYDLNHERMKKYHDYGFEEFYEILKKEFTFCWCVYEYVTDDGVPTITYL